MERDGEHIVEWTKKCEYQNEIFGLNFFISWCSLFSYPTPTRAWKKNGFESENPSGNHTQQPKVWIYCLTFIINIPFPTQTLPLSRLRSWYQSLNLIAVCSTIPFAMNLIITSPEWMWSIKKNTERGNSYLNWIPIDLLSASHWWSWFCCSGNVVYDNTNQIWKRNIDNGISQIMEAEQKLKKEKENIYKKTASYE